MLCNMIFTDAPSLQIKVLNCRCGEGKSLQMVYSMEQIGNLHNHVVTAHSQCPHMLRISSIQDEGLDIHPPGQTNFL